MTAGATRDTRKTCSSHSSASAEDAWRALPCGNASAAWAIVSDDEEESEETSAAAVGEEGPARSCDADGRGQSARRRPELESGGEVLLAGFPRKGVQWRAAEPDDDRRGPEGWTATTPERCCALRTFGLPKLATHRRDCKAWHCERRIYDAPEPPGGRLGNHVAP